MNLRKATLKDLDAISAVEAECFPKKEAATREQFEKRLKYYGDHFLLMFEGGKLVSFVDGFCTNERDLADEMYKKAELHDESGKWQMIFGVNTIPEYRNRGCAGTLLKEFIKTAKDENRVGLVLTCKEKLINYYSKFGFINEGVSESVHGDVVWFKMRLTF